MAYHDEYVELISAAVDGALSPAQQEKLEAHLALCPECRALYEELTALYAALLDLPPVEVPAGLTERIMAAVAAEQVLPFAPAEKKKPAAHWQRWLASAAVLAVVIAGAWGWKPWETATKGVQQQLPAAPEAYMEAVSIETKAEPTGGDASAALTAPAALQSDTDQIDPPSCKVKTTRSAEPAEGVSVKGLEGEAEEPSLQEEAADSLLTAPRLASLPPESAADSQPVPEPQPENGISGERLPMLFSSFPKESPAPEETEAPAAQPFMVMANSASDQLLSPYRQAIDLCAAFLYPEIDLSAAGPDGSGQTVTLPFPDNSGDILFFCDTVAEDGRYLVVCDPGDWASQFWVDLSAGTVTLSEESPLPSPADGAQAEALPVTPREALERLVEYIFAYSGYDSVEYTSEAECLYAQVEAQGCGGTVYFLPEKTEESLYWFKFIPETGDDVYSYTVSRLTGEPTSLLGEGS